MAIISTIEVKTLLGITSTDYDTLIGAYLPIVTEYFFQYTNNYFDNNAVLLTSGNITASSSGYTIVVTGTNFSTYSFVSGDEIRVRNSKRNDGIYTATTVSSATITVASTDTYVISQSLKDETSNEATWTVNKIDVPMSVKLLLASMVKAKIDSPAGHPKSESLGDYSVDYGDSGEYSNSITQSLNTYRMIKFV